ncbi:HlyD family type I secretion periplasmic adaptor subunit [Alphaproteobacteria bacterium]|nr:HlyD family type I secretion periplasmic adaptor subunit [Alphaproteobacteria bacterium]
MSKEAKDTDFMSELQAAVRLGPSTPVLAMFFTIIGVVIFGIAWASIAQVEQLARGQGQVVPTQEIKYIQSLEGGILQELNVAQGQQVKAGDVLLRLSDIQFSSEERGTEAKSLGLRAQKTRLDAEANGEPFVIPEDIKEKAPLIAKNEEALYNSRQQELKNSYQILDDRIAKANADISEVEAQINRYYQNRKSLNEELTITREMVRKRAVPKLEELRLNRELTDINGQINALAQSKKSLQAELQVAKTERDSQADTFRSKALSELNQVETDITGLGERLKSIGDQVDRSEIVSPVDGIVNKITINTIGGVVEPAQVLMEVVPVDDELKITAKIKPNDIGFLKVGQKAKVKVSAYDSQIYGSLDGELTRIAANTAPEQDGQVFFEIDIKTEKNHLGTAESPLPITPGMQADVDIIAGKRTIMAYLLKPIFRAKQRVFTER